MNPTIVSHRPPPRSICRICEFGRHRQPLRRSFITAAVKAPTLRRLGDARYARLVKPHSHTITTTRPTAKPQDAALEPEVDGSQSSNRTISTREKLSEVKKQIEWIKSSSKVEPEAACLKALAGLEEIARKAIAIRNRQPLPRQVRVRQSSASVLLSMGRSDEEPNKAAQTATTNGTSSVALPTPAHLSELAYDLLKHPKVFISPAILGAYVNLQRLLGLPRAIPEMFHLYATKPVPKLGSSPPQYMIPNPKAAKQAIPKHLADETLTAAIQAKDLLFALDVVELTYRAPAWIRRRRLEKFGVPTAIATATPLALYLIAEQIGTYANYLDPMRFKWYAFAGLCTYVLCTSTLGFVALTTHNDHFKRVIWRPGYPLLERYLREDERAAMDRIACAWGFKELWKWGDEEGEVWEGLKELILVRDMILDKSDRLPGMNP